jgi:hypothetical protein
MMGVVICHRYNQPRTQSTYFELNDFVNVMDEDGIPPYSDVRIGTK